MKRVWWLVLGASLVMALGAAFSARAWYVGALQPVGSGPSRLVLIKPGDSQEAIGAKLLRAGVIRSLPAWKLRARGAAAAQPGSYRVSSADSVDELLRRFAAAETADVRVTFPEGFTLNQCAERAAARGISTRTAYLAAATAANPAAASWKLKATDSLEGYLFPDTYLVPLPASAEALVAMQIHRFDDIWAKIDGEAKRGSRSQHEIVVTASLIERETRHDDERARIAGVIANRLRRGMRLQIDATVLYALGAHKDRVLYRDLEVDSPYNTYKVSGLPPGPICCPGRPSLEAALSPEQHDYLYYVLGPDGRHVFTRTLAEHNAAKARRTAGG